MKETGSAHPVYSNNHQPPVDQNSNRSKFIRFRLLLKSRGLPLWEAAPKINRHTKSDREIEEAICETNHTGFHYGRLKDTDEKKMSVKAVYAHLYSQCKNELTWQVQSNNLQTEKW